MTSRDAVSGKGTTAQAAGGSSEPSLPRFAALVVDIAAAAESHDQQDGLTDFVLHMLEQDYQIYLCSSTNQPGGGDVLAGEDFDHRRLTWVRGEMPPSPAQLAQLPALAAPTTLWISDDRKLEAWAQGQGAQWISLGRSEASFGIELHLSGWGQLTGLLDPSAQAVRHLAEAVVELRRTRPPGPVLVGLGGPPESGFERLGIALKHELEAGDVPLVDLIDLTGWLSVGDPRFHDGKTPPFPGTPADRWLVDAVLQTLAEGKSVYFEKAPDGVSAEFKHHFPLYLSEESVVIFLGEALFQRAIRDRLHLAAVVDVGVRETARRAFEAPEGETLSEDFTDQYLAKDGRVYQEYLVQNQVFERADFRINGNSPRIFVVQPSDGLRN